MISRAWSDAYHGRMTGELIQFRLLLLTFAGWISRHQQDTIEYLVEENRV